MAPPPLTSKPKGLTQHELEQYRLNRRRELNRQRMARKRAELKAAPLEEQALAAQRARVHQATYREKNRADLRVWEAQRRLELYRRRFGNEAYTEYLQLRRDRRRRARNLQGVQEGLPPIDYERRRTKDTVPASGRKSPEKATRKSASIMVDGYVAHILFLRHHFIALNRRPLLPARLP
ncbi:hypothetical protein C8R43DRAFT_951972 [Mycena crocata]|nr:hypothetical protein C8R43DRAFT_951972 [Mycena crocata]